MTLIDEYLKNAGGKFLKAVDVHDGDTLTIEKLYEDSETFDNAYIVIEGTFSPSKEERAARLGVQNVERVIAILGNDETKWIGNNLEVIGTAVYKGLGQTGILWRGQKKIVQAPVTAKTDSTPSAPGDEPDLKDLAHPETITWLKSFNVFAGMEIPGSVWDSMPEDVKAELAMRKLVSRKDGKPWLHKDAEKV